MTQEEIEIKKYMNDIEHHLKTNGDMKARINSDLGTDIHARMEAGESFADIRSSLGSAKAVAAGFNEELAPEEMAASKWRFVFLALGAIFLALVVYTIGTQAFARYMSASVGIIGGADGPTAIFVTSAVPTAILLLSYVSLGLASIGTYILLRRRVISKAALIVASILAIMSAVCALILVLDLSGTFIFTPMPWAALALVGVCIYKIIKVCKAK